MKTATAERTERTFPEARTAADIADALGGSRSGDGWLVRCPAHDDRTPSLSLTERGGKVLVKCHAGCAQPTVIDALRERALWPQSTTRAKSTRIAGDKVPNRPPDRTWLYPNASGTVVRRAARWDFQDRSKCIRSQIPNGRGGWRNGDMEGLRPLYNLPELLARPDAPVLVVEGEPAADAAQAMLPDWVVVTSAGGAKAASSTDWTPLRGRHVVVWPDADAPGREYANNVAAILRAVAGTDARLVALPDGLPDGFDLADPIPDGLDVRELIETAATVEDGGPRVLTLSDFLAVEFPPRENILDPIFPRQGLAMLHAWRGLGKTYLALSIALAAASAGTVLRWRAARPWRVLFVDGEMPGVVLQQRLAALVRAMGGNLDPSFLRIITPDLQPQGIPDLGTPAGQAWLDSVVGDADMLMLDNLSSLVRGGSDNADELWLPMSGWLLRHRAAGRSAWILHHDGKGETQRGISKREDHLDTVVHLRKPKDYHERDGARFNVSFGKNRGFYGRDAEPFEARLIEAEDGGLTWALTELEDARTTQIAEMLTDGRTVTEIVKALDIGRATVDRHKQKAIAKGLYHE